MMKKLMLAAAAIICILAPATASAATIQSDPSRESIRSFNSTITVGKDAMLSVVENIRYDMGGVAHHGLERLIPVSTKVSGEKKYINYNIEIVGVSEDDHSAQYTLAQENGWYRVRIGDPNITKTGVHNYTITYTYGPNVSQTDKGDLFDYNIFGTFWALPAEEVKSTVTFPSDVTIKDQLCFTGVDGSRQSNCTVDVSGSTVTVATSGGLEPYEGLDLQVLMPSGSFTAYVVKSDHAATKPMSTGEKLALISILALFALFIAVLITRLIGLLKEHRAKKNQTIVPQYESPDNLSPAEVGMLIDRVFDTREIVATLVDLAIRGYVKIRETKPKSFWSTAKYELDLLKAPTGLKDYETDVLGLVFDADQLVSTTFPVTAPITRNKSASAGLLLKGLTDKVKKSLEDKSYFVPKGKIRISSSGGKIAGLGKAVNFIFLGIVFFVIVAAEFLFLGVVFIFILAPLIFVKKQRYTQLGYQEWAKVKGFEWFLTVTEKDRMKFENAPAKTPELFNKLLPYAIAFGVEKKWAQQFADINVIQSNNWYSGSTSGYTALALSSSLSSSFSSVVSSNVVPTSSSGGFGGGGAGGGGGGGGGGGW